MVRERFDHENKRPYLEFRTDQCLYEESPQYDVDTMREVFKTVDRIMGEHWPRIVWGRLIRDANLEAM
jgi:hypothetical protein